MTRGPGYGSSSVALSPDGRTLVIAGTSAAGQRLYQRSLDRLEATADPGDRRWVRAVLLAGRRVDRVLRRTGACAGSRRRWGGGGHRDHPGLSRRRQLERGRPHRLRDRRARANPRRCARTAAPPSRSRDWSRARVRTCDPSCCRAGAHCCSSPGGRCTRSTCRSGRRAESGGGQLAAICGERAPCHRPRNAAPRRAFRRRTTRAHGPGGAPSRTTPRRTARGSSLRDLPQRCRSPISPGRTAHELVLVGARRHRASARGESARVRESTVLPG